MSWLVVNCDGDPVFYAYDRFDAEREADVMNLRSDPLIIAGFPYEPIEVHDDR